MHFFRIKKTFPNFPGQMKDEKIEIAIRKSIFAFAPEIIKFVLRLMVFFFLLWLGLTKSYPILIGSAQTMILIVATAILLMSIFHMVYVIFDNYMDIIVVTSKRIIQVNQKGIFKGHSASETGLESIEDVHSNVVGFWESVLRYGTLNILTASSSKDISMSYVRNPMLVVRRILDTQNDHKETHEASHDKQPEEHLQVETKVSNTPSIIIEGKVIDLSKI